MIKNVAVPALKHSPILGQEASSQTVFRPKSRRVALTAPMRSHWGAFTLNHSGLVATACPYVMGVSSLLLLPQEPTNILLQVIIILYKIRRCEWIDKPVRIQEVPLRAIRRPLPRSNDPTKVQTLMASIAEIGLQEPIEVLEVDGVYYGFSGCHRYEACTRLGYETIRCRVRKAPRAVLQQHLG